jgi:hypothetical protein
MTRQAIVVTEMTDIPQMDPGAPLPLVLADDYRVVLSYLLPSAATGPQCAAVCFDGVATHSLGGPNDEALHGHPLWGYGLKHYAAFTIESSPLIERLEQINSAHPFHRPERFRALKHFVFTLHDSTFECVAASFHFTTANTEMASARLRLMEQMLEAKHGVLI